MKRVLCLSKQLVKIYIQIICYVSIKTCLHERSVLPNCPNALWQLKKQCARVLLSFRFLSKYFFAKILKIKYIFFPVTDTRIKSFIQEKKSLNMTDEWTTEGQSFVQCIFAWPIVIYTFEPLNVFNFNFWMQIILHSIFCLSIILNCLKNFCTIQ